MRIFGKARRTEIPELTLVQVQENGRYNFFAALAKALLLFMLIYGALGGFLSAFEIEFNNGLCILVLFGLALILSAVYETEKRWFSNLVIIALFIIYLYIAVSNYWVINSGYYAILNRFYEVARQYLNVDSGMEYSLAMEETYTTVTMFALFLGMVGVILMNIMLQNKCSLSKVVVLTLSFYLIPFYFDCSPELIYILFLLTGYLAVAILQGGNVREKLSRQMSYVLPFAAVVVVLIVRIISLVLPENGYKSVIPKNAVKEASEENMTQFAQYGLMSMLRQGSVGAGVSGGRLNKNSAVMPSYETVLKVRYTPYDYKPVYLKAYTGKEYRGDLWTQADDELPDDGLMLSSVEGRVKNYEDTVGGKGDGSSSMQGRGIMEIEKVDDSDRYIYKPYYTYGGGPTRPPGQEKDDYIWAYFPDVSLVSGVKDEISDAYLEVPVSCRNAVQRICDEAGFAGTEEEIAAQIVSFFDDNYSYTLRPGFYYGNPDYISHFLLESKRGYCAHFASAGTMLFRQMGIPARYVEGYAFSYYNILENGELVEGAEYSDYYDGYSPIGETALIEIEIPDAYAHAWVEIYVEGQGWIVVDPTPAQNSQEDDTTSFWQAFMSGGGESTVPEMAENNLGTYLESALGGMSYVLLAAAVIVLIGLCTVYIIRAYKESKLPGRERVRLEYGRIESYLGRKHRDYRKLRTLREQLDWMRDNSRLEIDGQIDEALYQVYFAESVSCDCEALYNRLRRMRRRLSSCNIVNYILKFR